MPDKTETFALAGYAPTNPKKLLPLGELTPAQKNTIKGIIRAQLADGPLGYSRLRTRTVHFSRTNEDLRITGAHVAALVEEMRAADEFAPGYGAPVKAVAAPGELDGEPKEPK